jgi:hypothetical protein
VSVARADEQASLRADRRRAVAADNASAQVDQIAAETGYW